MYYRDYRIYSELPKQVVIGGRTVHNPKWSHCEAAGWKLLPDNLVGVPLRHVKWVEGAPVEMSPEEKLEVEYPGGIAEARSNKILEIDAKTAAKLDNEGVQIEFDFGAGVQTYTFAASKTAKTNWMLLKGLAENCMDGRLPEASFFPMNVQLFPSEAGIPVATAQTAFLFTVTVLSAMEQYRGAGAYLKNLVANAETIDAVLAIEDLR